MTVEVEMSTILWLLGGVGSLVVIVGGVLYSWIQSASQRIGNIETAMATTITEVRAEKIVKDALEPVNESLSLTRKDMNRLTHELNQTINVIRTNMSDLMIKLVGR